MSSIDAGWWTGLATLPAYRLETDLSLIAALNASRADESIRP
jgi:hypothetical protein